MYKMKSVYITVYVAPRERTVRVTLTVAKQLYIVL